MSLTATPQLSYEEFRRQHFRPKVIDYTEGTPNTHLSVTFDCFDGIIGRITPEVSGSLYILDFVWPHGRRVEDTNFLAVWDVCSDGSRLAAAGSVEGYNSQLYFINDSRIYEVRSVQDGRVLKKISWPPTLRLE